MIQQKNNTQDKILPTESTLHSLIAMGQVEAVQQLLDVHPELKYRIEDGLNVLRHYCFKMDNRGQLTVLMNSDGADAFKYFAVSTKVKRIGQAKPPQGDSLAGRLARATASALGRVEGGLGWMK